MTIVADYFGLMNLDRDFEVPKGHIRHTDSSYNTCLIFFFYFLLRLIIPLISTPIVEILLLILYFDSS